MDPLLPIFILIPVVAGTVSGLVAMRINRDGFRSWYQTLRKAPWNPPQWVFGPVWTVLYLLMGYASYRILDSKDSARWTALGFFWAQLTLNILWSPVFFGMRKVIIAVYIMVVLWCLIAVTLTLFWLLDMVAGAILVPYLLWVSYALTLNIYIVKNNSVESLQHQYPE